MHSDSTVDDSAGASSNVWLPLRDDHRIILYTLVSLAIVVGGHRTWREYHRYRENAARRAKIIRLVETSRKEKEKERPGKLGVSLGSGSGLALSGEAVERDGTHASPPAGTSSDEHAHANEMTATATELAAPHAGSSGSLTSSTSAQDLKKGGENATSTKRGKERKKRGRDVYKAVLKQERKKSSSSSTPSTSQLPLRNTSSLQVQQTTSGSEADASRSRSRSSSRVRSHSHSHSHSRSHSPARSLSKSRSRSCLRPSYEEDDETTEDTPRPGSQLETSEGLFSISSPEHSITFTTGKTNYAQEADGRSNSSFQSLLGSVPPYGINHDSNSTIMSFSHTGPERPEDVDPTPASTSASASTLTSTTTNLNARTPTPPLTHSGPSSTASDSISSSNSTSVSAGAGSPSLAGLNIDFLVEDVEQVKYEEVGVNTDAVGLSQPIPIEPAGKVQPAWLGSEESCPSRRGGHESDETASTSNGNGEDGRREYSRVHAPKTPSSSSAASFAVSDTSVLSGSADSRSSWEERIGLGLGVGHLSPPIRGTNGLALGTGNGSRNHSHAHVHGRRTESKSPPPPPRFRSLSRPPGSSSPYLSNSLPVPFSSLSTGASPSSTPPPPHTSGSVFGHGQREGVSYRLALETVRRREAEQRKEVDRCKAEIETMRTRWNEDVERGRQREAELQAQLQVVTSQMHTLSLSVSHMQMHPHAYLAHPPSHSTSTSNYSHTSQPQTPTFPPYPAMSVPSFSTLGPGTGLYTYPGSPYVPGAYPYPLITTLPTMTPRSASGSTSGSASGSGSGSGSPREYALGLASGTGDSGSEYGEKGNSLAEERGVAEVDEDSVDVREELVEAILKRPGSIGVGTRSPSAPAPSRSWSGPPPGVACASSPCRRDDSNLRNSNGGVAHRSASASVTGRGRGIGEKEGLTFTFASLSELGNPGGWRHFERERSLERGRDWVIFDTDGRGRREEEERRGEEEENVPLVQSPEGEFVRHEETVEDRLEVGDVHDNENTNDRERCDDDGVAQECLS